MNPFTQNISESVSSVGETALLQRIRQWLGQAMPEQSPQGMGDDCAVTDTDANLLTCDSLVYGTHFDDTCPPELAGAKLLKRNLSDIASMGGLPKNAVVALFLPKNTSLAWIEGFTKGLSVTAMDHSTLIVGGDITGCPTLCATLTLTGRVAKPLTRGTAQPGDRLYVSSPLGGSIKGHHLTFTPRIEQGMFLAFSQGVTSCMDLSDGLAKDLPSLLGPKLRAELEMDALPPSAETLEMAGDSREEQIRHILCDGEDYELLFSIAPDTAANFEAAWADRFGAPPFPIGTVSGRTNDGPQIVDAATGLPPEHCQGYEHLR